MSRWLVIMLLVLLAWAGRDWSQRAIEHAPGVLVQQLPKQHNLAQPRPFEFKDFVITPRAEFEVRARVLSTERYRWGPEAELAPVDLALGWGVMSDQAVVDRIRISQGNRWYFTRYQYPAPVADGDIIRNSSNMHIIPANAGLEDEVRALRPGDVINLKGWLVDVAAENGFRWSSSLSRDDTGDGSCELFFVNFLQRERRP